MRRLWLAIVAVMLILVALRQETPTTAQDPCSGLVPSRLQSGQTARVVLNGDGLGNTVRDGPGKEQSGSQVISALAEGAIITVVQGPICLDGLVWWSIEMPNGGSGWTAEGDVSQYYLEPYEIGLEVYVHDAENTRQLNRFYVSYSGDVTARDPIEVSGNDAVPANQLWQQPDLDAASLALADRLVNCPEVLIGTAWEGIANVGDVIVPEGDFVYVPSPIGGNVLLVRHRVLSIPTCGGAPGPYFGISTVHLLSRGGQQDLFPYGQHNGARSKSACQSPDVPNLAWVTDLSNIEWSPDGDTVALTVRYLDQDASGRNCAFYYIYLVDVFSGRVDAIAEGRRPVWANGGSKLYYFTRTMDNGYNVLREELWQLSEGKTTQLGLPTGAQFVPVAFDSIGVQLPATSDGTRILVCNTLNSCPDTLSMELADRSISPPIPVPANILPYQVIQIHYVAGDTRLLWLTNDGHLYIQAVQGVDTGLSAEINLDAASVGSKLVNIQVMPTGLAALLQFDSGAYLLLNTINRTLQALPELKPVPAS